MLVKNLDFFIPLHWTSPLGVPVAILFDYRKKLESCDYPTVKNMMMRISMSIQYRRVTNRLTDGHLAIS